MVSNVNVDTRTDSISNAAINVRTRRVVVSCVLGLFVLGAGVYLGPQTIDFFRFRETVYRPPEYSPRGWSSAPKQLDDKMASTAEGTVLSYYGYTFEAPWNEPDGARNVGRWVEVRFKAGQVIRIFNPEYFPDNPISSSVALGDDNYYFVQAFGAGSHESKYDQFKAICFTTPSNFSPLRSRREYARIRTLLGIKGLWFEHNPVAPDIFYFETVNYRGFEFSGLSRGWQDVSLNLFDRTDGWFQIVVIGDSLSGARITQGDINRIIQSVGPKVLKEPKS